MYNRLLTLDIKSSSARFIHMTSKGWQRKFYLTDKGSINFPHDLIVDGEVLQPDSVAATIKSALQKQHITTRRTALAVNSSRLILRQLDLPPLPIMQLRELLTWELERYIPYSAQETKFALLSLELNDQKHTVLLAAILKDIVASLLTTLKLAGLRPVIVEPGMIALFRWIQYSHSHINNSDIFLLDLGSSSSNILIASHGKPIMARTITVQPNDSEATQNLLSEIRRSLDFAQGQRYIASNPYCLCTGHLANSYSFLCALEESLGIHIKTIENNLLSSNDANLFVTNLGLGLGWWGGEVHAIESEIN